MDSKIFRADIYLHCLYSELPYLKVVLSIGGGAYLANISLLFLFLDCLPDTWETIDINK